MLKSTYELICNIIQSNIYPSMLYIWKFFKIFNSWKKEKWVWNEIYEFISFIDEIDICPPKINI